MKRKLSLILSLVFVAVLLVACGNNGEKSNDSGKSEQKVLRVGATGLSFPNSYKENDKLVGYDVDVIKAAAKELGYKVEWTTSDFSGLLGQLDTKKIDTIANAVAVTDERKDKYNFSDTYSYVGITIVTSKKNKNINTLDDLKGKTVSGVLGSNNVTNLEKYDKNKEIKIRTYENRDGAISDTINNRVDGFVNAEPALLAEIKKSNLPLKFVGKPFTYEEVAFPFVKDSKNEELVQSLNKEIQKLKDDGTLAKISEKYFGKDVSKKE
ncbi:amino acid ABC transporter substrate-binding protein [Rummeliibacillus sp. SL167]|uniref:amino acid ABC transporter substrate-binding protein n=1 Tax=Rummeliibacillus sp. SL167 TaxID=2579792 RepID=UPI0011B38D3C|nr:amino acid ABC transporter substrate-binding protein [Rummeliibacillus sp. SL167]